LGDYRREDRQDGCGVIPADQVEEFASLVHEVPRVPAVEEDVVGGGAGEQVGQLGR